MCCTIMLSLMDITFIADTGDGVNSTGHPARSAHSSSMLHALTSVRHALTSVPNTVTSV